MLFRKQTTSVVADFKWKLASLPALTLRGNAPTSRLDTGDPGAAFVRQESPRRVPISARITDGRC